MNLETKIKINKSIGIGTIILFLIALAINSKSNLAQNNYPFIFGIWLCLELFLVGMWATISGYLGFHLSHHVLEAFSKKAKILGIFFTIFGAYGMLVLIPGFINYLK